MRRIILAQLAIAVWFGIGSHLAWADGLILPEALSPDYLAVRYHHVTVDIEDNHAVTRVEQEFFNPHPFPINGRYLFPVPPDGILSRFRVTVDGHPQAPIRQDAQATNTALYDTVVQRRDPSLLRYADWETLALDLNIPAGGVRRMNLEYEEVLAPSGGLYRYRYVLSTERYSSQPLEHASLTVNLHSSSGLSSLYSSTHPVSTERLGPGRARVAWEAINIRPTEDFELFFAPTEGGFGGGLLMGRREGQDHFVFLFAPDTESVRDSALSKDIVFVLDRSGSMSGEKIRQAQGALHFILGQLNANDRFSIVGFDHRLSILAPALQPVETATIGLARRFVDDLNADGNTDLEAALQAGLEILARSEPRDAPKMIVFLTDGLPTAGVTDDLSIADLVSEANAPLDARVHVFGVGYDVNTHLLDRLAADNGGTVTYVQPSENLEAIMTEFYERIALPVLTDIKIQFEGLHVRDLHPQELPDLFQGSSLLLTGRYHSTASSATVRVRGQVGGERQEFVYHFDLEQNSAHDFVPRLWATRRIGALLDQVRIEGESSALVDEIRDLSLGYGLVTPYTTFVIEAQADGAASAANMALYANLAELNQAWGQTTVQARVQNQLYQQATQANLASGANVSNSGQYSLARVSSQSVDLTLLRGREILDVPITLEWIQRNIDADHTVAFGSQEYFTLARDPVARSFLQSSPDVIFGYQGQVISVQDSLAGDSQESTVASQTPHSPVTDHSWFQKLFLELIQAIKARIGL